MQIFKNSGAQEVIVSSVQIELHGSLLEIAYLLGNWEIVHAYQLD
jgi:hypothetical protein